MPQAVNPLVIKNGAGTPVDKSFVLYAPSAGDKSVATWKLKEGTIAAVFPVVTASAHATANKSRKMQGKLKLPSSFTDAASGLTQVGPAFEFDFSASIPDAFPEVLKADAIAYAKNIVAHALFQEMMRDGSPAT